MNLWRTVWILVVVKLLLPAAVLALQPSEVAVVCNKDFKESCALAEYYLSKRNIPEKNLIALRTTREQSVSRAAFEADIAQPVRAALSKRFAPGEVRALAVVYGVPLSVGPPSRTAGEEQRFRQLGERREVLREILNKDSAADSRGDLGVELEELEKELKMLRKNNFRAAVDSELMLVLAGDYPLQDWLENPLFIGNRDKAGEMPINKERVVMVGRLDGPSPAIVRRLIDDSLAAEQEGLSGTAYFDARYPLPEKRPSSALGFYDLSIHRAADRVRQAKRMPVVVDSEDRLFQPGEAADAALYCGWYSLARYVDAFAWRKGAVGYHIASQECQTLRDGKSQVWCKRMLEEGAAAVIGPVGEPFLQAFPIPEVFFSLLVDGRYTLAESYLFSLPWLSWKMVLVGDPLYRPFKLPRGTEP